MFSYTGNFLHTGIPSHNCSEGLYFRISLDIGVLTIRYSFVILGSPSFIANFDKMLIFGKYKTDTPVLIFILEVNVLSLQTQHLLISFSSHVAHTELSKEHFSQKFASEL